MSHNLVEEECDELAQTPEEPREKFVLLLSYRQTRSGVIYLTFKGVFQQSLRGRI